MNMKYQLYNMCITKEDEDINCFNFIIRFGVSELVSACAGLSVHILKASLVSAFLEMELNC